MEKMAHGLQRMGRADGGGFYEYDDADDEDDERELWSGLKAFERRGVNLPEADIGDRLRFAPVVAWLHARTEARTAGQATSTGDDGAHPAGETIRQSRGSNEPTQQADTMAAGSQLWAAGQAPSSLIDTLGEAGFAARAAELQARYGERFKLPAGWETVR